MEWQDRHSFYILLRRFPTKLEMSGLEVGTLPGRLQRHGRGGSSPATCWLQHGFRRTSVGFHDDQTEISWSFQYELRMICENSSVLLQSIEKPCRFIMVVPCWKMLGRRHGDSWGAASLCFDDKSDYIYSNHIHALNRSINMKPHNGTNGNHVLEPMISSWKEPTPCNLAAISVACSIFGRRLKFGSPKEKAGRWVGADDGITWVWLEIGYHKIHSVTRSNHVTIQQMQG